MIGPSEVRCPLQSTSIHDLIFRHRLLDIDSAHALLAPEQSRKEFERIFEVEKRHGNIAGYPFRSRDDDTAGGSLRGRKQYYLPTAKLCREWSKPEKRSLPLGPQALVSNYAFLLYCSDVERRAKRLTREDLEKKEQAKPLLKYGMSSDRYATSTGPDADGFVLMVADCNATIRTLKRKVIKEWMKRKKHPEWAALMESGQFTIMLITSGPEKAKRLRRFLRDSGVQFDIAVYPELTKLFGGDGR